MAKLINFNGRFCESEYENAFISFLEENGWNYLAGNKIGRNDRREVLYQDDMMEFLKKNHPNLMTSEIEQIIETVRLVGAESDFAVLHDSFLLEER